MIKLIMSIDQNYGIAKEGKLAYSSKTDLKRFKLLTNNSTIIMGRKTWDSLPQKPLKNRHNLIYSRNKELQNNNFSLNCQPYFFNNFKELYNTWKNDLCDDLNDDLWIIGGNSVIEEYFDFIQEFHITEFQANFNCDVFCHKLKELKNKDKFKIIQNDYISPDNEISHKYIVYKRI